MTYIKLHRQLKHQSPLQKAANYVMQPLALVHLTAKTKSDKSSQKTQASNQEKHLLGKEQTKTQPVLYFLPGKKLLESY